VYEVHGRCGGIIVVDVGTVDPAQPEQAAGVTRPHERAVGYFGEAVDATCEALLVAWPGHQSAEATQTEPESTVDCRLWMDAVTARSHRRTVDVGHTADHARYAAPVATFWRYIRIQLTVFVFGCVGPIFLGIYFAVQPDPTMKWSYWAGLFITTADVLIALALTNASAPDKVPTDVRTALAAAKRMQGGRGHVSDSGSSTSSTYDPLLSAFGVSNDCGSSSADYSSSSSDYSSSSDSGSSSSND
jgi:hypothetical protein